MEARCYVENEDVVGAAPTGDAPTTSEWSTIVLLYKVWLIIEIWRYVRYKLTEITRAISETKLYIPIHDKDYVYVSMVIVVRKSIL